MLLVDYCQFVGGGTSGIQPPSFNAANGRNLNNSTLASFSPTKLALPPRYGVTVVSTPPPTVRLYVANPSSDDDDDLQANPDRSASAKTKINSVGPEVLSSPSSDPISSGGDVQPGSGSADSGVRRPGLKSRTTSGVDNCVNPSQRKCNEDRKLSASGGDSGNATTTSGTKPEVVTTTTTADVTWLTDHQGRPGPLPFPPSHITFDDNKDSDTVPDAGMDSCDDSFHQSTETVVMRDAAAAAKKAAAAARRKSVYYNATPEPTTATSASSDADLVTLPRIKQRHHHHHGHSHQRHRHSQRQSEVDATTTSLDRGGGASGRRHAGRTETVPGGGGSGRRRKLAVSEIDATVHHEMTTSTSTTLNVGTTLPQHNPATCRVTRSTIHSDSAPTTVRFQSPDALRPDPSRDEGAPASGRPSRVTASTTSTRTFGPACVTVTPLTTVDPQCARFPVTSRDRSRPLDAADLLRSEYEASFGREVNPLLLYSTGGGATGTVEPEVTLSKQTVYDNVQYFNM